METLALHSQGEEEKYLEEIETAAHPVLPNVPIDTLDKTIRRVRELSIHCAQETGR